MVLRIWGFLCTLSSIRSSVFRNWPWRWPSLNADLKKWLKSSGQKSLVTPSMDTFHQNYMQRPLKHLPWVWIRSPSGRHAGNIALHSTLHATTVNCIIITKVGKSLPADHTQVDATETPSINCLCSSSGSYSHHTTQPPPSFQISSCKPTMTALPDSGADISVAGHHLLHWAVERTPKQSTSVPNNAMGCQWIHHAIHWKTAWKLGTRQLRTFFKKYQGCYSCGKLPKDCTCPVSQTYPFTPSSSNCQWDTSCFIRRNRSHHQYSPTDSLRYHQIKFCYLQLYIDHAIRLLTNYYLGDVRGEVYIGTLLRLCRTI